MFYDSTGQRERKRLLISKLVEYTLQYFDQDGSWIGEDKEPELRERLWYAASYLESGEPAAVEAANRIIVNSSFGMCHFSPMASLQLLTRYENKLHESAREALVGYLSGGILDLFSDTQFDFRGANDNYPTMGTYTMLAGGLYFGRPDYTATGIQRLKQFESLLTRRGFTTECNSPTYTPIQVYCMAEICELVREPSIRKLALQLEERLWVDIWTHYHPTTFQTAGPYSRAYAVDSTAHTHQSRFVLYALLGERLTIHPMNTIFSTKDGKEGELIHHNIPFMQVSVGWLINTTFHCPVELVEHGLNKSFPYSVKGTFETSASTELPQPANPDESDDIFDNPAASGSISTFMTEDYALGVMTREFRTGIFTDSYHLLYRRRKPVREQQDIATVYANYIVNNKKPGQINDYVELNFIQYGNSIFDEGRKIGLHHERTAMILYKPKLLMHRQVTSLKLSLLFSARYGYVDEVWFGDTRLEQLEGQSVEPCPVFVKDGPVYMAYFPLLFTNYGRRAAVKAEKINDYLTVSFYNYEGPPRDFAKRGFLLTGNGFVAEVSSETEAGSFESFRSSLRHARVEEKWAYGTQVTHMRHTEYERENLHLECVWNPISEGIKFAAVNGKIPIEPQLDITGLNAHNLPFMSVASGIRKGWS